MLRLNLFPFPLAGFLLSLLVFGVSCSGEPERPVPLGVEDFSFEGPLGSQGAEIARVDTNHFRITLGAAPNQPGWPNKLNMEILRNAKGNDLLLEVEFGGGPGMSFNEYFQSWSYDGEEWHPVKWEKGFRESPQYDRIRFPVFEQDRVWIGTQVPFSFEQAERMKREWAAHPDATLHTVGRSIGGLPLYRLEITASDSDVSPENRWVHYFANQHPGEHNSQWRMAGMVDWILGDEGEDFRRRSVSHFIFYMSPDASRHGWYRVNAEGVDMNRSYHHPGADPDLQTHEAYLWQRDLEELMESEAPVTTIWAMHTWQGIVEPLLRRGPEFGTVLGSWTGFRDIMEANDPDSLIKPLALREGESRIGPVSWTEGPAKQFGITAVLCEGGSTLYTREENRESGRILIESIAAFYRGTRP